MNRLIKSSLLVVGLVLFLSLSARAEDQPRPRLITVSGEAEVKVAPDEVILTLGVETRDMDMMKAQEQNDRIVKRIFEVAKTFKVENKFIQTDFINIEPLYKHHHEDREFIGYLVRKTIAITLKDVSQFDGLLSGVLNAGANYVQGVNFRTTELRKYRDQARSMAIKAAKDKALNLAGELGQKLGKPQTISEGYNGWWSGYNNWWGRNSRDDLGSQVSVMGQGNSSQSTDTLALGLINVSAKISVVFELE